MATLGDTVGMLSLLAEPTRIRLLQLLCDEPLSVAELTRITDLRQSRVSTHLGKLKQGGFVRDRRLGNCTMYDADPACFPPGGARLWSSLRAQLDDRVLASDADRRQSVVSSRQGSADAWPDEVAGQMERHYSPGRTWEATARGLMGLMHLGEVLDIGSGDGAMTQLLAGRCRHMTSLDRSERVVDAARRRLAARDDVEVVLGDMHDLPFDDARFDQVLMLHVLTYAERPADALREAGRVLRPGGDLVVVTLAAHTHGDVSASFGHKNTGFEPEEIAAPLREVGLEIAVCEVTSRERRVPYFEILSAFARKPAVAAASPSRAS